MALSGAFRREKGRYINGDGYVVLIVPKNTPGATKVNGYTGCMTEHRYVMQKVLGRPLLTSESVHHLNGDKTDNRIENLELWVTNQPSGQRPEDLVAWAHEILGRYGHLSQATFGREKA